MPLIILSHEETWELEPSGKVSPDVDLGTEVSVTVPNSVLADWERFLEERKAWAMLWQDLQTAAEANKLITDWYEADVMNDEWNDLRGLSK